MILEALTLAQILAPNQQPTPQPTTTPAIVELLAEEKPKDKKYTVEKGDTLNSIGKENKVNPKRIWAFNKQLEHQDVLEVGEVLKIPHQKRKLKPRAYIGVETQNSTSSNNKARTQAYNGSNTYEAGQCVWYVKNRKPSIPNGWGSAYSWIANARASGWTVSSKPIAGAVGAVGNHVVYVESVQGDEVTISEMNYNYVAFSQRTVTVPASKYTYIY